MVILWYQLSGLCLSFIKSMNNTGHIALSKNKINELFIYLVKKLSYFCL